MEFGRHPLRDDILNEVVDEYAAAACGVIDTEGLNIEGNSNLSLGPAVWGYATASPAIWGYAASPAVWGYAATLRVVCCMSC